MITGVIIFAKNIFPEPKITFLPIRPVANTVNTFPYDHNLFNSSIIEIIQHWMANKRAGCCRLSAAS